MVVDTDQLRTRPFGSLTGTVVNFADISNVALVFVDGALKKCRGRLVGADYQLIAAEAERSRESLLNELPLCPSVTCFALGGAGGSAHGRPSASGNVVLASAAQGSLSLT